MHGLHFAGKAILPKQKETAREYEDIGDIKNRPVKTVSYVEMHKVNDIAVSHPINKIAGCARQDQYQRQQGGERLVSKPPCKAGETDRYE